MDNLDKDLDDLLSARPFKNKKFNLKNKEKVMLEINHPKKRPSYSYRSRMIVPIAIIVTACIAFFIWLPSIERDNPIQGNENNLVETPIEQNDEGMTLAENEDGVKIFVKQEDEKDGSYSKIYVKNQSGLVRSFDWEQKFWDPDFPPTMEYIDVNNDSLEELLIVMTQDHGAGVFLQEAHILQVDNLETLLIEAPVNYVTNYTSSSITIKNGKVSVQLKVKDDSYNYSLKESEAGVWYENLNFNYISLYHVRNNLLQVDIPAVASVGGLTVGRVTLTYGYDKSSDSMNVIDMTFTDTNGEKAENTIIKYGAAIADRDTKTLAELYGGSYDWLEMFAPETDRTNKEKIFEAYLQIIPDLYKYNEYIKKTKVSDDEYIFVITFKREDGSLFDVGDTESRHSTFTYTVKKIDGQFKVMEPPPYQA